MAAYAAGPATVNLGSAADFVILAKSGISTTGTSAIAGDMGVSPIGSTAITGFGLIMDSSNQFSTSSLVNGKIYASNYAAPTPTKMTTAVSDMETAYVSAAGRPTPTATGLGAGNIGGMTLAPGLYKWTTGVTIPTGLALTGGPNDVWIFQIAQNLDVSNGVAITLNGGAQAKNIFWQVAGQAILGTTSDFKGTILSKTAIVMNNGAKLDGRALAQTAVTMIANNATEPTDTPLPPVPTCNPDDELVANGGFETPAVTNSALWDIYGNGTSGLGWNVEWMANNTTTYQTVLIPAVANLELLRGALGTPAEGSQYTELDSDWDGPSGSLNGEPASVKISQILTTVPGQEYTLNLKFSPRPNYGTAENMLRVSIEGTVVETIVQAGTGSINWSQHSYTFTANSTATTVELADVGTPNNLGTLVDEVSVKCSEQLTACPALLAPTNTVNITACAALSSPNTMYVLTQDLSSGTTCFQMNADNITLNCNGHFITGTNTTSTYGAYSAMAGTVVKNCIISNYQHEVYFEGMAGGKIANNSVSSTHDSGNGILVQNSECVAILDNKANGTLYSGIKMVSDRYMSVERNLAQTHRLAAPSPWSWALFDDSAAIYANFVHNSTITNNTGLIDFGHGGLYLLEADNNTVTGNNGTSLGASGGQYTGFGMAMSGTANNVVRNNYARGASSTDGRAFEMYNSDNNLVEGNTFVQPDGDFGSLILSGNISDNTFTSNRMETGARGIFFYHGGEIIGNTFIDNVATGRMAIGQSPTGGMTKVIGNYFEGNRISDGDLPAILEEGGITTHTDTQYGFHNNTLINNNFTTQIQSSAVLMAMPSFNNLFRGNTFDSGAADAIDLGMLQNSTFEHNTIKAPNGTAMKLGASSSGNLAYANIIQGAAWVNTTLANEFNQSLVGNRYLYANGSDAYPDYEIIDTDANNYADAGSSRPFGIANMPLFWFGPSLDNHPYTLRDTFAPVINELSLSQSGSSMSCSIRPTDAESGTLLVTYALSKNGVGQLNGTANVTNNTLVTLATASGVGYNENWMCEVSVSDMEGTTDGSVSIATSSPPPSPPSGPSSGGASFSTPRGGPTSGGFEGGNFQPSGGMGGSNTTTPTLAEPPTSPPGTQDGNAQFFPFAGWNMPYGSGDNEPGDLMLAGEGEKQPEPLTGAALFGLNLPFDPLLCAIPLILLLLIALWLLAKGKKKPAMAPRKK